MAGARSGERGSRRRVARRFCEDLNAERGRHTAALADWLAAGSEGERPASRVPELEHHLADLQAEYDATGIEYDRTLRARAEHVERNRSKMVAGMREAVDAAAAAADYLRLVAPGSLIPTQQGLGG